MYLPPLTQGLLQPDEVQVLPSRSYETQQGPGLENWEIGLERRPRAERRRRSMAMMTMRRPKPSRLLFLRQGGKQKRLVLNTKLNELFHFLRKMRPADSDYARRRRCFQHGLGVDLRQERRPRGSGDSRGAA